MPNSCCRVPLGLMFAPHFQQVCFPTVVPPVLTHTHVILQPTVTLTDITDGKQLPTSSPPYLPWKSLAHRWPLSASASAAQAAQVHPCSPQALASLLDLLASCRA
jgi:hypothetical protein